MDPSIKAVIAGDIVYNGVHVWTAETDAAARKAWLEDAGRARPRSGATTVVAGHKDPKREGRRRAAIEATRAYLKAFDEAVASVEDGATSWRTKMKAKYPTLPCRHRHLGAAAQFPAAAAAPAAKK